MKKRSIFAWKRGYRFITLLLCVNLLVTSIPAAAFAETTEPMSTIEETVQAEEVQVATDANGAEASDASTTEAATEPASEIESLREETVKHFLNEDGSYTAVNYMVPVHYQEEGTGEWTEIDNTLSVLEVKEDGTTVTKYIPQDSPLDVQITDSADSGQLVSLQGDEHKISWSYENLKQTKAERKAEKHVEKRDRKAEKYMPEGMAENLTDGLVYEDIADNTDLEIVLDSVNLKENLILKDKHAQTQYVIRYDIGSLTAEEQDDHTILLKDGDRTVFTIHAPYMTDSAGAVSDGVSLHIFSQSEGILRVVLTADKQWVKDKHRVYPVIVDPYILELSDKTSYDATAFENVQGSSYPYGTLAAGNDGDYATGDGKAYIMFNLPDLKAGDMVTGGELYLYQHSGSYGYDSVNSSGSLQLNAHRVSESWTASDIINQSYSSAPSTYSNVIDYVNVSQVSTETQRSFDISRVLKDWYNGESNYGICIKADSTAPDAMARFIATDNTTYTGYYHPFITVRYLNNKGLEDRWTYHEQSPGEKGTGYVNDYTGNLVYTVPLLETTGELMPVSLSLVYNGYQNGRVDQVTTVGAGWRLNIQQRVIELAASNTASSDADVNSLYDSLYETGYRYVYEDADGTDHYFRAKEGSTSIFVDEEGLGLELKEISNADNLEYYQITAEDGSKLTFTGKGYLRCAYDSDGNFYKVLYSGDPSGAILSVQDGVGRTISFTRDGDNHNRITQITGPDNRAVDITYTDAGRVYTVGYPDGNSTGFAYSNGKIIRVRGTDDSRIKYTYADSGDAAKKNRVTSVTEYSRESTAECLDEHKGQWLTITYGNNRTTFVDKDGFRQVYQFDNYGRTVSVNDSDGAFSSYSYINPSTSVTVNTEKAHLLSSSAATSEYVDNLLADHSFEDGTAGWLWTNAAPATDAAFLGAASAKLSASSHIVSQKHTVTAGESYTFSAYAKTDSTDVLPKLRVAFYDSSDTRISYTDTEPRNNKLTWARMHLSFEVPEGVSSIRVTFRMEGSGNAWFDCAQLESGRAMNRYNLVENSGFDKVLSGTWTEYNTSSADVRKTDDGTYYYLTGEGDKMKRLYQKIEVNKSAKNLYFSVSGLGSAVSVPFTNSSKRFALTLHTVFSDGSTADTVIRFNPDYTGAQYTAGIAGYSGDDISKTVDYIEVRLVYNYNENAAEFDKIQVNLDESGTSYTYDDEGNLITAADNAGRNQAFSYSDAGEILTAKSADDKNYTYTYADGNEHRLVSAVSESSDVKFSYEYNAKGGMNAQQVDDLDTDGSTLGKYIRTRQYYTDSLNYIDQEYDDRGFGYKYTWDETRGIITSARDQSNNETTYTYATDDDYLTSVSKDGSSVSYTYDGDNDLTKIASGSTAYQFGYDSFGNILTTKIGSSRTLSTNTYNNNNGNLKNSVYGNGFKLGYTYDLKDRITAAYHDGTAKFRWTYNADGQVGRHEDTINGKEYQYSYDLAGRILRTDISDGSMIRIDYNDISLPTGIHYSIADDGGRDVYFTYADRDNLPKTTTFGTSRVVTNTYDGLTRLKKKNYVTTGDGVADVVANYSYADYTDSTERTTTYVSHIDYTYVSGGLTTNDRFYTYGAAGNILKEHRGTSSNQILQEQYTYDTKGQVQKHYSVRNNETWVYTYDTAGNILTKKHYDGVTDLDGLNAAAAPTESFTYTYGDSEWGDLLTAYNGKTVTSDSIGNMTGYDGQSWSWKGRQLESYTDASGTSTTYKYNADGIRTSKTTGSKTTEYFLNGDQILMMKTTEGDTEDIIWFFYDSEGNRIGLCRNGTYMYYLYNVQGDVTAIVSAGTGKIIATYTYDTWGNCEVTELSGYAIGDLNPFRFKGYYWDEESGMYYLNSRYYSPELCRFISADSQINSDILGTNLFAYCSNNPVNCLDMDGHSLDTFLDIGFAAYSLWEALNDPKDLWKWGAFLADVGCMFIPGATGGGAVVRAGVKYSDEAIAAGVKYSDEVIDGVRITRAVDFTEDAATIVKNLDRSNGYTKSSLQMGRQIHKGYKATPNFNLKYKEFNDIKGIRPDYIDFDNNTIYELKPNNPRSIKMGIRQLHKYNNSLGGGFKMVLELY